MGKQLFIPNLGTILILTEDWTFRCFFENRNSGMIEAIIGDKIKEKKNNWRFYYSLPDPNDFVENKIPNVIEFEKAMTKEQLEQSYVSFKATNAKDNAFIRITLPKGTQLKVDRIYIKQGGESFASVTFRTNKNCPETKFKSKRFWVKLQEANQIIADVI